MKTRVYLLLSLLFALIQGPFLPVVFIEGILLVFLLLASPGFKLIPAVFVSGLIFDLIQNQTLGITSTLLMLGLLLFSSSFDWFQVKKSFVLGLFATLICALRWKLSFGYLPYTEIFITFVLSFILLNIFWKPVLRGKIQI